MKAIILAAGSGARMRPLTDARPKAMLEVAGQTVIERMIRALHKRGISEICVVVGHCRDQLESYLARTFPEAAFTFVVNDAFRTTNNIYSMHLAFEQFPIDADILLIESDLVFAEAVLDRILESPHANVALVDRFRSGMDGTVVTVQGEMILHIIPPHLQGPGFDFSDKFKTLNIYKFSRDFAQTTFRRLLSFYATTYNDNCYYELVLGILVYMRQAQIFACDVGDALWCELDDPNDVRIAEWTFAERGRIEAMDAAFGGFWNLPIVDFAFIRNMHFPNHSILSDMRYNLPSLVHNYGSTQAVLNRKLAYFLQTPPENVCLLNGLSQVYPILRTLFSGKAALLPEPTFGEYPRAFPQRLVYRDEGLASVQEIPAAAISAADIVVFVNPNNPTGSCLASEEIMALARAWPEKLVIVDESFIDFAERTSVQELLLAEPLRNVWVLKSLSKCLGMPGLRLGYVFSPDDVAIARLNEQIPVWNVNSLCEYFLETLLKHRASLAASFRATIADRTEFVAALESLAAVERVYPSGANFLLVRLALDSDRMPALREALLNRWGCFVKDVTAKFADGRANLRLAVRLPEENARFASALEIEASVGTSRQILLECPEIEAARSSRPFRSQAG